MPTYSQEILRKLRDILSEYFNEEELRDLCFDLGVDYEVLPGKEKRAKSRELITHLRQRDLLFELVIHGIKLRPNAPWPSISENNPQDPSDILSTNVFPYESWMRVNIREWQLGIEEWFSTKYSDAPLQTMSQLLDHAFSIWRNTNAAIPLNKIMKLGKELQKYLPESSIYDLSKGRDLRILILLERGLHRQHSDLFMLPQVYKSNLLNIDEYSALLLSTKLQAAGDYESAFELVKGIARGCPLAQYVMGRSYRAHGNYRLAHERYNEGMKKIALWEEHKCPFNIGFEILCNPHLLTSALLRSKANVFRKQEQDEEAENFYAQAEAAIERAIKEIEGGKQPKTNRSIDDIISANYERDSPYRVQANIYFSHGYYWYEQKTYDKAEELFKASINSLERAKEKWDSPYTRLAIVQLCKGKYREAADTFTQAYEICRDTPVSRNREASLSLALCTLGMQIIDTCFDKSNVGKLAPGDPDLETALNYEPKLTLGPLECHRDDASHLLIPHLIQGEPSVIQFINRLNQEINKLTVL